MTEQFCDLSHHNTTVDLAAYAKAGHTRIALKATEGTGFTDPAFAARWQQAGQLGLARVAYHFARVGWPGSVQFDFLLATVNAAGGLGPRDRLCLDAEDIDTANAAKLAPGCVKAFASRAAAQGVSEGLVYSYRYYLNNYGIRPDLFPAGWQQLWLADYTAGQADSAIELGGGWTRPQVAARQYTDQETVAGIGSTCDANRVLADWLPKPKPPPTPTQPPMTQEDDVAYLQWPAADRQALLDDIWRMLSRGEKIDGTKPAHVVDGSIGHVVELVEALPAPTPPSA